MVNNVNDMFDPFMFGLPINNEAQEAGIEEQPNADGNDIEIFFQDDVNIPHAGINNNWVWILEEEAD